MTEPTKSTEKKGRTEIVIFASLATALILGIVLVLVLPGRSPNNASSAPASASSSAAKPPAPVWVPPTFADEDVPLPEPSHAPTPDVVASGNTPVIGTGSSHIPMKGQDQENEFPFTAEMVKSTTDKYSPRLATQCPANGGTTKVTVFVDIMQDGWVKSTKVQSFEGDEAVAKCVADKMARWHFQSTTFGGTASIPVTVSK